jgi:CheY-like chemotaxis protein
LLEVRDTGQGISESDRRHLFEPFFTTKKTRQNSGLGLAIVFGVVSNCGGRIDVQSEPGAGAAFRIFLPAAVPVASPAPAPPTTQPTAPPRRGGKVLVVDDREDVRLLASRMVEQLGYEVITASSGAEALELARSQKNGTPPLLLTDVVMPGMNGRELSDEMRRIFPGLKTVFMSGYSDHILSDTGALDSSTQYIQKPFTVTQLDEILRRVAEA